MDNDNTTKYVVIAAILAALLTIVFFTRSRK